MIGRGGRDLTVAEAASCIAGYVLMNDWSARDIQLAELEPCRAGDTVTISVDQLGVQRSRIVEGPEPVPDDLGARRSP